MTIIVLKRNWVVHWHWAIVNMFAVAILLSLSYWQWQRAAQKQESLNQFARWQAQPAASLTELFSFHLQHNLLARDGASIAFNARWVTPFVWLLDNQLIKGRPGYDVVIPVQEQNTSSFSIVLVNLGWVAAPPVRTELPSVHIPNEMMIQGIYRARTDNLLLGKNIEDQGRWPMRLQKIDNQLLSHYLPVELLPGVVYQQQSSPFLVHYNPVVLPPERHKAYALQWLLLAVAALLVGLACARETARNLEYESSCKRGTIPVPMLRKNANQKNIPGNKVSARNN